MVFTLSKFCRDIEKFKCKKMLADISNQRTQKYFFPKLSKIEDFLKYQVYYLWSLPSNSSSRYSSISWIFVLYLTLYAFWKILLRLQNFPAHSYGNGISEWRHWRVKNRQMSAEPSVTKVHEISFEIRYFLLSGHFSSRFWDTSQSRNSK